MFQIAKGKYVPGHVTGVKWLIFTSSLSLLVMILEDSGAANIV